MLYFRDRGWPAAGRLFAQGANDCGDIDGVDDWVIQAKNTGVMELGRTCTAAAVQARRAGKPRWACIFNRRQHGLEHSYVVMDLRTFTDLIGGSEHGVLSRQPGCVDAESDAGGDALGAP